MLLQLLDNYKKASKFAEKSLFSLLLEATRLRFAHNRIGYSEYLDFQLFKDDLNWADKCRFGGIRTQAALEELLIDDYSKFLSLDKVTMYTLMGGFGLPIPGMRAVYRSRRPMSVKQIEDAVGLAEWLCEEANRPVYFKRSFGSYGRGNCVVTGVERGEVQLGNGRAESLSAFCESLDDGKSLGWLLQDPLAAHPAVSALTGSKKISGLRIHTFLSPRSTHVTKAIFKLNMGLLDSDNFEHGVSGNMLAAVDLVTGKVVRAIAGVGLGQHERATHPNTGRELVGFAIPNWRDVLDLAHDAQKAFPGFICPGWDIALCADGPKILEVNAFGDIDLSQHAYRHGFCDAQFLQLLGERGLDRLLYAPSQGRARSPRNGRLGARRHHWLW